MWFLLLLVSDVLAAPNSPPMPLVALIPVGTSMNMTWEGEPPRIFGAAGSLSDPRVYRRYEFTFLDYQVNRTVPLLNDLTFNFDIFANVTFGEHPRHDSAENFTESGDGHFFATPPSSTDGFLQLLSNGFYNGANGKINIDRTATADSCALDLTNGYFAVYVRPAAGQSFNGGIPEGYFFCPFDVPARNDSIQEPDSLFGPVLQCKSGFINGYNHRLWYKARYYNIDSKICDFGNKRIF